MSIDLKALREAAVQFEQMGLSIPVGPADLLAILDRLEAAERERGELRKDAERYRFIRDAPATGTGEPLRQWLWSRPYGAGRLDEVICAAMSKEQERGEA